jgi:thiol-disulfide isomerase/thioredoxin
MAWFNKMMDERPNLLVLLLASIFGLGGFLLSSALFSSSNELVGSAAPTTLMRDLSGTEFQLAKFRGKPVVVNFWATWCGPCIEEMPMLDRAHRRGEIHVVAIASDDASDVRTFKTAHKLKLTVVLEADAGGIERLLDVPDTIPYTVFFDREGKVSAIKHGAMSQAEFDAHVEKAAAG